MAWCMGSEVKLFTSLHSITTKGRPFTSNTISGIMHSLTPPGVSRRYWLMATKLLAFQLSKSMILTTGFCSPVITFSSTCHLFRRSINCWLFSNKLRTPKLVKSSYKPSSCSGVSQVLPSCKLMALTALMNSLLITTSRKLARRLLLGSVGIPAGWSITVQFILASWLRSGFSTNWYSDTMTIHWTI